MAAQECSEPTLSSRAGSLSLYALGRIFTGWHVVVLLIAWTVVGSSGSTCFSQPKSDQGATVQHDNGSHASLDDEASLAANGVEWLASKTGWKTLSIPIIKRASREQMSKLFFGSPEGINGIRPLALYAKEEHVLYLAYEIDLKTLLGRRIFLHELVHHLQVVNEGQFECPEAAEVQAYQLQGQWLHEQGIQDVSALIGFSEVELNNMVACEAGF